MAFHRIATGLRKVKVVVTARAVVTVITGRWGQAFMLMLTVLVMEKVTVTVVVERGMLMAKVVTQVIMVVMLMRC